MQSKADLETLFSALYSKLVSNERPPRPKWTVSARLMHTSGTTKNPLPVIYTEEPDWNPLFLGEGDRVVMMFGSKPLMLDFLISSVSYFKRSRDIVFMNPGTGMKKSLYVSMEFKPTVIVSPPTTLLMVTKLWDTNSRNRVKNIVLAGELMNSVVLDELQKRFSNANVLNMYSSTETGLLGVSCRSCRINEFHVSDGTLVEITNSDENGVGDIIITKNNKGGVRLTKYSIGDVGFFDKHNGQTTIRLCGRRGFDYIKLSNALLLRSEFDRVVASLSEYITAYKAEVQTSLCNGAPIHTLTLWVALTNQGRQEKGRMRDYISDEFSKRLFVTPTSTLKEAIRQRIFTPVEVFIEKTIEYPTAKPQKLYYSDSA